MMWSLGGLSDPSLFEIRSLNIIFRGLTDNDRRFLSCFNYEV